MKLFKDLKSVPSIYKCWICGQILKLPQLKICLHSKVLTCFQCMEVQRCLQCPIYNQRHYFQDPPEIFVNHLSNIFIHCLNCNNDIQGFKFLFHENKCFTKYKQINHFEILKKNISFNVSLDEGQLDYKNNTQIQQFQMNYLLKYKIQMNEEQLLQIQELLIKCELCFSIIQYTNLLEHQNSCPYQSVECDNYCCNWIGQRQQFQNHLLECYPKCQEKLRNQSFILIRIQEFTAISILKNSLEKTQNDLEFQNIIDSIQLLEYTEVQSDNEIQFDNERESQSDNSQ